MTQHKSVYYGVRLFIFGDVVFYHYLCMVNKYKNKQVNK